MAGLWRLTRNRYGRALYEALTERGVTATWMSEYVRPLGVGDAGPDCSRKGPAVDLTAGGPGAHVSVTVCEPERVKPLGAPVGELVDDERVIAAFDGERPLGYLFVSVDATLRVAVLERSMTFDGAYLRRVYVAPDHRQRGIASALLGAACHLADGAGAERATALVARDNRPSRGLFEKHGFDVRREHRYLRVGPLSLRSTRER